MPPYYIKYPYGVSFAAYILYTPYGYLSTIFFAQSKKISALPKGKRISIIQLVAVIPSVIAVVVSIFFLILLDSFVNVFTTAVNYILNERRVCGKVRIKHVHAIDDFVCEIAVSRYSKLLDIIFHVVKSIEEQICDLTISKVCVYLRKDFVQKLVKLNKTELLGFGYDL